MNRIEWTDVTWNPIRGCSPVSPGCANCYAARQARRMSGPGGTYEGLVTSTGKWTGEVRFVADKLDDPLHWREPRRVFVNSMSDLFHPGFTNEQIAAVFGVMAATPQHTYQVLTKRPERAIGWYSWIAEHPHWSHPLQEALACHPGPLPGLEADDEGATLAREVGGRDWPLPNVHLIVSCEDQLRANKRIPILLRCPAVVRGVSLEPLLGPIDLTDIDAEAVGDNEYYVIDALTGKHRDMGRPCRDVRKLDWVIVGGESGPGARPMHPHWVRSIRDQCRSAGVPFFFKGWGEWIPGGFYGKLVVPDCMGAAVNDPKLHQYLSDPPCKVWRVGKRVAGKLLDDQVHRMFPGERWMH